MITQKLLLIASLCIVAFVQLSADGNTTKKYNETEMENSEFITLQEFDEWLKVNDYYEAFVKAYNISPKHLRVKQMKCLYLLDTLYGDDSEMSYDEMLKKCSSKYK